MQGTHRSGSTDSWSRDSSVSTATGLWGGQIGVRFWAGRAELRLLKNVHTDSRSHQASYSTDTGFIPEGRAAAAICCLSTPPSAEVENECGCKPTATVFVHGAGWADWDNVTFFWPQIKVLGLLRCVIGSKSAAGKFLVSDCVKLCLLLLLQVNPDNLRWSSPNALVRNYLPH